MLRTLSESFVQARHLCSGRQPCMWLQAGAAERYDELKSKVVSIAEEIQQATAQKEAIEQKLAELQAKSDEISNALPGAKAEVKSELRDEIFNRATTGASEAELSPLVNDLAAISDPPADLSQVLLGAWSKLVGSGDAPDAKIFEQVFEATSATGKDDEGKFTAEWSSSANGKLVVKYNEYVTNGFFGIGSEIKDLSAEPSASYTAEVVYVDDEMRVQWVSQAESKSLFVFKKLAKPSDDGFQFQMG